MQAPARSLDLVDAGTSLTIHRTGSQMISAEMRAGWQRTADAFGLPVFIIKSNGHVRAVITRRELAGDLLEVVEPKIDPKMESLSTEADRTHGLGAVPGRCYGEIK